jgi:hypothetical protein
MGISFLLTGHSKKYFFTLTIVSFRPTAAVGDNIQLFPKAGAHNHNPE